MSCPLEPFSFLSVTASERWDSQVPGEAQRISGFLEFPSRLVQCILTSLEGWLAVKAL